MGHLVDHRFGKVAGTLLTIVIAHVLSVLFAFVMHRRFVFRMRGHVLRDLMRFWSVYLMGAGINIVALAVLVELGLDCIPAYVIVMASITPLSYFGHRHFSYRRSGTEVHDGTSRT